MDNPIIILVPFLLMALISFCVIRLSKKQDQEAEENANLDGEEVAELNEDGQGGNRIRQRRNQDRDQRRREMAQQRQAMEEQQRERDEMKRRKEAIFEEERRIREEERLREQRKIEKKQKKEFEKWKDVLSIDTQMCANLQEKKIPGVEDTDFVEFILGNTPLNVRDVASNFDMSFSVTVAAIDRLVSENMASIVIDDDGNIVVIDDCRMEKCKSILQSTSDESIAMNEMKRFIG
eukprot:TRINITY_DN777981_c0_g1_i1.p1 TRINITY_DN777981_c0_g1~~TRINITY_DN777981_c0_g1_i1.p1  ORF type:complete len:235 (-),score=79.53 TRINITY_DN777981_c0_g1_i1:90-794(-)